MAMYPKSIAETLLELFDLSELLEMNDLTDEEVLRVLINEGLISQPEHILEEYEEEDNSRDDE